MFLLSVGIYTTDFLCLFLSHLYQNVSPIMYVVLVDFIYLFFFLCKLDYDKKAENAVDYEDIDEQYEGPEVQTVTEEDFLLPKKDFFSKEVLVTSLENTTSVFDDDNYDDEDDDMEKQNMAGEGNFETQLFSSSGITWLHNAYFK